MIQSIIENICKRKGWDKVNIQDKEAYYDFPAGNFVGANRLGDKWDIPIPSGIGVIYSLRQTYIDGGSIIFNDRTEISGDESHTYYPVANTDMSLLNMTVTFVSSDKIIISESKFSIRLPALLCYQYNHADEKYRMFRIRYLLITPIK